jgi:hypothetical protein
MKITYTKTKRVKTEISDDEADRIAIEVLRKRFDIPKDAYIDEGWLKFEYENHGGTHSWTTEEVKRKATIADRMAVDILDHLCRIRRERNGP